MAGLLRSLPVLDSGALAAARRRELDIDRSEAELLGTSALAALRSGRYELSPGRFVDWRAAVSRAVAAKVSLAPSAALPDAPGPSFPVTEVQVTNETTLGAARRLHEGGLRPLALNFANGVAPGGGFLSGSRAQEECLCRSSALYATLQDDVMYAYHRGRPLPDSSSWAILSPHVPVFRHDDGRPLPEPWDLDIVTCAAPYAPTVGREASAKLLAARIDRVLAIAHAYGYEKLVLGAWGCGAFGNDPRRTAEDFRAALEGPFAGAFGHVVFAVTDWSPERRFLGPFRDAFG